MIIHWRYNPCYITYGQANEDTQTGWGDWTERAITWEILTATTLLHSGADIVVLRHPESIKEITAVIDRLMAPAAIPYLLVFETRD